MIARSSYYELIREYKTALDLLKESYEYQNNIYQSAMAYQFNSFFAQYDYAYLTIEKQRLLLKNQQLDFMNQQNIIRRLDIERSYLINTREKDSLELNYAKLVHKTDSIDRAQKEKELRTESKYKDKMLITTIIFFIIVISCITIYIITKIHSIRELKKEKKIAELSMHEAQMADNLKSEFLNNMSHEIRTPLNAIVGFTDILNGEMSNSISQEEKNKLLGLIHTNTTLLTTLINDILELSRMQTGNYKLNIETVNLTDVCRDAIMSVKERCPNGVNLFFEEPKDNNSVNVYSDYGRILQILINFLTNACKYTQKGFICLNYSIRASGIIDITVTDTGIGIPADKAEMVFKRFEKLDSFKQGTGLGLNICYTIAQLLNGLVWLDTNYTNGCRFVLSLDLNAKNGDI